MEKKVRFGDLVRNSGRPQIVTLWTDPAKDRTVSRATKENRLLTVMEPPHKTRFGRLGLKNDPHAVFLIFPRPLNLVPDAQVVGINYQLAELPDLRAPSDHAASQPNAPVPPMPKPPRPIARPKPLKRFKVRIQRTATLNETLEIEAESRQAAKRRATDTAHREPFDLDKADVREQVTVE